MPAQAGEVPPAPPPLPSFNSLFEMHQQWVLFQCSVYLAQLSILYLRCHASGDGGYVLRQYSFSFQFSI